MFDAGTTMIIDPLVNIPGMDSGYFRELDMEYTWPGERQVAINNLFVDTPTNGIYRPWPDAFPWRCWMDHTDRYEGEDGGPHFTLYQWDDLFQSFDPVPLETATIIEDADYDAIADPADTRVTDWMTSEEVVAAEGSADPTTWLRQPLRNEVGGRDGHNCDLKNRVVINQAGHTGAHFTLAGDYNPIYAPFDLRHPEWYDVLGSDGQSIDYSGSQLVKDQLCSIINDSSARVYVRPANWRWVATVKAYYYYVSWFEFFLTSEIYTQAYFNRPPIYPVRHDLIHTTQTQSVEWENVFYSSDPGISYGFNSSRSAGWLRYQIIDAQWWSLSEAYIFAKNDPLTLALWLWPPEAGDIVLGIGNVDHITGDEQVIWFRQNRDLTDEYPRTVIGSYIVMDFVAAN